MRIIEDIKTSLAFTLKAVNFIIFTVAAVVLVVLIYGEPFKRGFFCDDESLMHPDRGSTVGISLATIGFGFPLTLIVIVEYARWKLNVDDNHNIKLKLFNRDIPFWAVNVYNNIVCFLFGAFCTLLVTDIGKQTVGRLRPHFISVCQPIMSDGTNCSSPINAHRYIEDFTCSNKESTANQLRQMRLSFPSGHASFSMYTMIFVAFYLQYRMQWNGSTLFRPLLQFLIIMMAWFTSLSRVSDYKHHCKCFLIYHVQKFIRNESKQCITCMLQGLM